MKIQQQKTHAEALGMCFSTGSLARLANGAVTVSMGNTTVLVTTVVNPELRPEQSFFPLTVDYREKFYAAGRFPGGYLKREGRPSDKEILISRLCDRPLRPLFPTGFMNEVQVIGMLLSADLSNEPDVLMVNGASAALMLSDIPWNGPIGCVRIGEIGNRFIINPTHEQMMESRLNLVYAGNEHEMMMIEGNADQMPEERFCEALEHAQAAIMHSIRAQKELAAQAGKAKRSFPVVEVKPQALRFCKEFLGDRLKEAVFQDDKQARETAVQGLKLESRMALEMEEGEDFNAQRFAMTFDLLQEQAYREGILNHQRRVDGRGLGDLRPIALEVDVLPQVHGSALFQRGQTQSLAVVTLGTGKDMQELDGLTGGARSKSFILHYNFPPFSVGECGRFGFTSRREVGHGNLAEGSLLPVLPEEDTFPYAVRITSEVLESNGSSSMATVCAGCLALMDAGVPISAPVAGISIGLVSEMDNQGRLQRHALLTDILGAEDHYGDMDFKVAGTRQGITGFQLDLKIKGLPLVLAKEAILKAKEVREHILNLMSQKIEQPRQDLNPNAPRIHMMMIDPEKIGLIIGPGGKNIRRMQEVSGAEIEIDEDNSGRIRIYAAAKEAMDRAISELQAMVAEIEPDRVYRGRVTSVKEFGAFVECLPGKEGLVHISELAQFRVRKTEDVCKEGDEIIVKCIGIDEKGRVRLSRKAVLDEQTNTSHGG